MRITNTIFEEVFNQLSNLKKEVESKKYKIDKNIKPIFIKKIKKTLDKIQELAQGNFILPLSDQLLNEKLA